MFGNLIGTLNVFFILLFSVCTSQSDWIEKDLCEPAVENQNTALLSGVRNGTTGLPLTRMGQGGGSGIATRFTPGHTSGTGPASSSASAPLGKPSAVAPKSAMKQPEFKKSDFKPGDHMDMSRFSNRVKQLNDSSKRVDPKNGEYIVKDTAGHGGSYWKLCNKSGKRVASFTKEGKFLKP